MKKLLFLLFALVTVTMQAQTANGSETEFEAVKTTNPQTVSTSQNVVSIGSDGTNGKVAGENITTTYTPVNYAPASTTIKSQLTAIDTRLGQIGNPTAGITQRINFTGDNITVAAGTMFASNGSSKGTATSGLPTPLVNGDNQKQYFAKDLISIAQPSATTAPPGVYSGQLTVSSTPTPNGTQQRYTIEIYKTNNGGTPIASGITGAPTGNLGVTVVAILDSGLINLVAGAITNIGVSGTLASTLSLATGERLRYHVSAQKVGTGGGNVTMSVLYGSDYNSFYDITVSQKTSTVINDSGVSGLTASDALNTLNTGKQSFLDWKTPQDYGAIGDGLTDDTASIQNALNSNDNVLLFGIYKVSSTILIKDNQFIFSNNAKINSTSNTLTILKADNVVRWKIAGNLLINGSGKSSSTAVGLNIIGGYGYQIEGLTILNISGTGVLVNTGTVNGTRGERGMFNNTFIKNCYTGIQYGYSAEYTTFSNLHVTGCNLGANILSGNTTINGGSITDNDNGLYVGGILGNNNSHGIISSLNINHNTGYNVRVENAQYGQTFIGCHIYGSATQNIEIVNSYGVLFDSCIIDGKIENTDVNTPKGYHLFSSCQMDPFTSITGSKMHFKNNFTKDGIDFSENDFEWGLLGGKYMYAGAEGQRFAFSGSNTNVLYSGGSAGFAINNQADTAQILTLSDSGIFKLPNLAGPSTEIIVADTNGALIKGGTAPTSGTYKPTITAGANVSGMTLGAANYTRIGDIISVNVSINFTTTTANTASNFTVSVPVNRAAVIGTYNVGSGNISRLGDWYVSPLVFFLNTTKNAVRTVFIAGNTNGASSEAVLTFQYDITK